eukprot:1139457-Pelagomonas_calceolata.AAC.5
MPAWNAVTSCSRVSKDEKLTQPKQYRASRGRHGDAEKRSCALKIRHIFDGENITDWRSTFGPSSLFNSKSVNSQPESGSVAKNVMGKIQVHIFRHCTRRVDGTCISDRKCAPLMIYQPFTVVVVLILCPSCPCRQLVGSRHSTTQRTGTANHMRQPHRLHANQCHAHLIEIKYCEDTRPQHQLDAAKQQHADLCTPISAKLLQSTLFSWALVELFTLNIP